MSDAYKPPLHGRDHRPKHFLGPDDPGGADPWCDWNDVLAPNGATVAYIIGQTSTPSATASFNLTLPTDAITYNRWACNNTDVFSNTGFATSFDGSAASTTVYLKAAGLYLVFTSTMWVNLGDGTGTAIVADVGAGAHTLNLSTSGYLKPQWFPDALASDHPTIPGTDYPTRDYRVIYASQAGAFTAQSTVRIESADGVGSATIQYYSPVLGVAYIGAT